MCGRCAVTSASLSSHVLGCHSTTPALSLPTPSNSPWVAVVTRSVMLLRRLEDEDSGPAGGCGLGSCDSDSNSSLSD